MKCKQCNKRFQKSWKLAQHTKFIHPKLKLGVIPQKAEGRTYLNIADTYSQQRIDYEQKIRELNTDVRRCEAVMEIIQNAIYLKNSRY